MSAINNHLQTKVTLQFVKREDKEYQGNQMYYLLCNFFDSEGLASPIKVKVDKATYDQKLQKGQSIEFFVDIAGDYLRVTALSASPVKG